MKEYLKLSIHQKINLKGEYFEQICGVPFTSIATILSFKERINIFMTKLLYY